MNDDFKSAGSVQFPKITYTQPGVYSYIIRETTPSGDGWTTDSREYRAVVTVTDDGGRLTASVAYPDGFPEFVNTYDEKPAQAVICACKRICGTCLSDDGAFNFAVFDEDGKRIARATNQCGEICFPAIEYGEPGVYRYTIRELTPSGNCWITDTAVYPAVVTVAKDSQGQLAASIEYPQGKPVFVNHYCGC